MGQYTVQSHLPIFKKLFSTFDINSVFEYGIGLHSTTMFVENCDKVVSVEMNEHELNGQTWYDKVVSEIGERDNWEHMEIHGPDKAVFYGAKRFKKEPFDLVFADGYGGTRNKQTNSGIGVARFVICHDSQHGHTRRGWERGDYTQVDFKDFCKGCKGNKNEDHWPFTTVFCRDEEDAKIVQSWLEDEKNVCELHFEW
jgi:hypothetical protein